MENNDNVYSNRLIRVAESIFGGNKAEMARALDMSPQSLNSYIKRNTKPGAKILRRLLDNGVNVNWFLSGEGPMLSDNKSYPPTESIPDGHVLDDPVGWVARQEDLDPERLADKIVNEIMQLEIGTPSKLRLIAQLVEKIDHLLNNPS